ncbi:MAG: cupin domain-containing protein [Bacteroidia bacterium]|nr:cupin domain-containing protein [Bacteroidia bacterium]
MYKYRGQLTIKLPASIIASFCRKHPLIKNLFPTAIGYFPNAEHHFFKRPAGADFSVLIYCVSGKGWVKINQEKIIISAGEYIIIAAGKSHSYGADEKEPWTIYWFHFEGKVL